MKSYMEYAVKGTDTEKAGLMAEGSQMQEGRESGVIWLRGSFTVESALVFPIVILIMAAIIRLAYSLHDITVNNMLDEYAAIRVRSMKWSSYNPAAQEIDVREIANKPLIDISGGSSEIRMIYIEERIDEYREKIIMGDYTPRQHENVYSGLKNSTVVRMIHIMLSHAERISYD